MSNIQIFNFEKSHQVRTALKGNEPFFCLPDVCEILELTNSRKTTTQLDPNGIEKIQITDSLNRKQTATFINEPNLYRVIFRSNKAQAVKFQNWVFDEVLPSIRKTGSYQTPAPTQRTLPLPSYTPSKQRCILSAIIFIFQVGRSVRFTTAYGWSFICQTSPTYSPTSLIEPTPSWTRLLATPNPMPSFAMSLTSWHRGRLSAKADPTPRTSKQNSPNWVQPSDTPQTGQPYKL